MTEISALGHMRLAEQSAIGEAYYWPHLCIIKESRTTKRLRSVLGESCEKIRWTTNAERTCGIRDTFSAVCGGFLTADTANMYMQIRVNDDYVDDDVRGWQLTTVTAKA